MGIKGSVTINICEDGTVTIVPPMGQLDRNIQIMQWSLVAPKRFKFDADPIRFQNEDLPTGYSPWTTPPNEAPLRENDWQVRANVNVQVQNGHPPLMYRYDIYVIETITGDGGSTTPALRKLAALDPGTLEKIDPDMENQPQP